MEGSANSGIVSALRQVRRNIASYETRYARTPGSVRLLAVSKRKPIAAIRAAMDAGQQAFGENYVEEGVKKILSLDDAAIDWHFIGAIQSRKTASIAEYFNWAHGVDRVKVARRLSTQRPAGMPDLNICLQVNVDSEPGKAGVSLGEIPALAAACDNLPGLVLRGLMAIPAPRSDFAAQREVFARMRQCLASLSAAHPTMDTLSMGMSGDMEAAIAEGATIVRIGTAIFGSRDTQDEH
ncbi:MAG: YggS family pyridoxal phosphate-dependent enzyme [Granulosicoccus sp.]|nr:YggS family pyridoxal phosphate-dependent enzyme [Granulosicoccus sp.]